MEIKKQNLAVIHIETFPLAIGILGWSMALIVLGRIGYLIAIDTFQVKNIALFVGFLIAFFGGSAFAQKETLIVNIAKRELHWSRKGLFGSKAGTVPFEQVKEVVVQGRMENNAPRTRLAIRTDDAIIPVSRIYSVGERHAQKCQRFQELIRKAIA